MTVESATPPREGLYRRVAEPLLDELDYQVEQIDGVLPKELTGTLYRIGPGKHQVGSTLLHNIFDGDGLVSQLTLNGRSVRFRNRYVRTPHFQHGQTSNRIRYRGIGTQIPGGPFANFLRLPANMANTNLAQHDGELLALWELGKPHRLDLDTLETLGEQDFGGRLGYLGAFSAHPKWDPVTGEMFNFGMDLLPTPRIRCYRVSRTGALSQLASVPMLDLAWNHDFALTPHHLVFVLDPIQPNIRKVVLATHSLIDSLDFRPEKGTRFLLVPRGGGKPRIVEHEALLHFHLTNAYEDGTDTVIDLVRYRDWDELRAGTNSFRDSGLPDSRLMRYRISATGRVSEQELAPHSVEFPQYDWRRSTREHHYTYLTGRTSPAVAMHNTILKVDHSNGAVDGFDFGDSSVGEPLFVPRTPTAGEDQGWLLLLNHQLAEHRSQLVILDAQDLGSGPLASAWLNHHIPWGFHGTFTRRIAKPGTPMPPSDALPTL
jgi:all-trans-8'-apo-beta-carotenal 15,15'-oxygenase